MFRPCKVWIKIQEIPKLAPKEKKKGTLHCPNFLGLLDREEHFIVQKERRAVANFLGLSDRDGDL